jgi:hypothetical protein
MAAWAGESKRFGFVTNRSGEPEIWAHESDGSERPVVTGTLFPADTTKRLINPALSPAGRSPGVYADFDRRARRYLDLLADPGRRPPPFASRMRTQETTMNSWLPGRPTGHVAYLRIKGNLGSLT